MKCDFLIALGVAMVGLVFGQQAFALSIVSPSAGTIFYPGDTIVITVDNSSGGPIVFVADHRLGAATRVITQAPYQLSIALPSNLSAGDYSISAKGVGTKDWADVSIHVEPAITETSKLSASPAEVYLPYPGASSQISISLIPSGQTSAGPSVNRSTRLSATTGDASVAAVAGGVITGVSSGNTVITYTLDTATVILPVHVGAISNGDYNNDGIVDQADIAILQIYMNTFASGPNDARDLNHDGKIDALDARILTTLCTYPRCASTK